MKNNPLFWLHSEVLVLLAVKFEKQLCFNLFAMHIFMQFPDGWQPNFWLHSKELFSDADCSCCFFAMWHSSLETKQEVQQELFSLKHTTANKPSKWLNFNFQFCNIFVFFILFQFFFDHSQCVLFMEVFHHWACINKQTKRTKFSSTTWLSLHLAWSRQEKIKCARTSI